MAYTPKFTSRTQTNNSDVTVSARHVIVKNVGPSAVTVSDGSTEIILPANKYDGSEFPLGPVEDGTIDATLSFSFSGPSTIWVIELEGAGDGDLAGGGPSPGARPTYDEVVRLDGDSATQFAIEYIPVYPGNGTATGPTVGREFTIASGEERQSVGWRFLDSSTDGSTLTLNGISYTKEDGGFIHWVNQADAAYVHEMEFVAGAGARIEILIQKEV